MMLNDSMYGILFRDINPVRTFVDQRFSRQVHARAGIIINTGEDNYLTTADAVDAAHTVTTSQLLNEYFAKEAGLEDWQLGLGHAFEIDPDVPDSFRLELAHAMLARDLFPNAPLKWMPPTRHMTGDVFQGYLLDGFFNLVGALTGQGILLVGMMTEAVVTPWLSDRDLALQNVRYVMNAAGKLHEDFRPSPGRLHRSSAPAQVLGGVGRPAGTDRSTTSNGLLDAIADGTFGLMKRPADAGRGLEGVARKSSAYYNPASEILEAEVSDGDDHPAVRRHHRRRHGAGQLHAADAALQGRRGRGRAAREQDGHRPGDGRARQADGAGLHVLRGLRAGQPPRRRRARSRSSSATTRCSRPRRSNAAIKRALRRRLIVVGACIGTDAHTVGIDAILNIKGFAGEKGLEYYRELKVVNLGAQVSVPAARRAGPRREGRRGARLPGRHPARRAPAQHPRDVGGVPRVLPRRQAPAADRRRAALRRGRRGGPRRRPRLQPRYDARRGRVVPCPPARPRGRRPDGSRGRNRS